MGEFHEIWIEQCEAARDIREAYGLRQALGYLIGEKLLNFLGAADEKPAFHWSKPSAMSACWSAKEESCPTEFPDWESLRSAAPTWIATSITTSMSSGGAANDIAAATAIQADIAAKFASWLR